MEARLASAPAAQRRHLILWGSITETDPQQTQNRIPNSICNVDKLPIISSRVLSTATNYTCVQMWLQLRQGSGLINHSRLWITWRSFSWLLMTLKITKKAHACSGTRPSRALVFVILGKVPKESLNQVMCDPDVTLNLPHQQQASISAWSGWDESTYALMDMLLKTREGKCFKL